MLMATALSFGLLYMLMFKEVPDKNIQLFIFLAGSLCGFFFGSSINKQKTPDTSVDVSTPEGLQNAVKKYFNP